MTPQALQSHLLENATWLSDTATTSVESDYRDETRDTAHKSVFSRLSMLLYVSTWISVIRSAATSR
jgi:hypothetical protein